MAEGRMAREGKAYFYNKSTLAITNNNNVTSTLIH
jgi:hypothetical protein